MYDVAGSSDIVGSLVLSSFLGKIRSATALARQRLEAKDTGQTLYEVAMLRREVEVLREAIGRVEARQLAAVPQDQPIADYGFRAFSQYGEDGILRHLLRHVPVQTRRFVEFGVESFHEANCRWLAAGSDVGPWSGLVIDGSKQHIESIRARRPHYVFDLTAVQSFVTAENINKLITDNGFAGDLGLLSIDVDGVDWWIWRAIDCVQPAIVVAEYNARFGPTAAVTVPYDPTFHRAEADASLFYFGASLAALERLGSAKGYDLVGCGHAGLNAFFVRRDLRPAVLPRLSTADAWRPNVSNEWHSADGHRLDLPADPQARLDVQQHIAFSKPLIEISDDGTPGDRFDAMPYQPKRPVT